MKRSIKIVANSPSGAVNVEVKAVIWAMPGTFSPVEINRVNRAIADALMLALAGHGGVDLPHSVVKLPLCSMKVEGGGL